MTKLRCIQCGHEVDIRRINPIKLPLDCPKCRQPQMWLAKEVFQDFEEKVEGGVLCQ